LWKTKIEIIAMLLGMSTMSFEGKAIVWAMILRILY